MAEDEMEMDCPRCHQQYDTLETSVEKDYWLCKECCLILPKNSTWMRNFIPTSKKATALASVFALGVGWALGKTLDTYTLVPVVTTTSIIAAIMHGKYYPKWSSWLNCPHFNGDETKKSMHKGRFDAGVRNKLFSHMVSLSFEELMFSSIAGFIKNYRHYPGSYSKVCLAYCLTITKKELFINLEQTKDDLIEPFKQELSALNDAEVDHKTGMFKINQQMQTVDPEFMQAVNNYNTKSPKSSEKQDRLVEIFKREMPPASSIIMALEDVLHVVIYKFFNKQENYTGYWVYIPLYDISTAYLNQPDYMYPIQPGFINALMELTGVEANSIKLYLPYHYNQ
ncbi:hypothetical protein [Endozoicomonas sp. Mp262]|uniref:hypothetical protein n=1 Tax=Endozoicomonas sp. Mp262 TaxID=2919499 RepID=UPI0021DAD881